MILYNTTFIVEQEVHDDWFEWIQKEHINDYLKSNCFIGARLGKITSHVEPGAVSYSLQLFVNDEFTRLNSTTFFPVIFIVPEFPLNWLFVR